MKLPKEVAEWIRRAEEQGWRVEATKNDTIRFKPPTGPMIHMSPMFHEHRALQNAKARLRRAGLQLEERDLVVVATPREILPAIAVGERPPYLAQDDLRSAAETHPEYAFPRALAEERILGVSEPIQMTEVEIAAAAPPEEPMKPVHHAPFTPAETPKSAPAPTPAPAPPPAMPPRAALIRFGATAAKVALSGDALTFHDFLEQGVALGLTLQEVYDALSGV